MLLSSRSLALGYNFQQFFPEVDYFIDFIPNKLLHFLSSQFPHTIDEHHQIIQIACGVFFQWQYLDMCLMVAEELMVVSFVDVA